VVTRRYRVDGPLDPIVGVLRQARLTQRMTYQKVADLSGLNPQTIRAWESGASGPRLNELRMAAATLGVELEAWPTEAARTVPAPVIDEVAVERACHGEPVDLTTPERTAAVGKLHRRGLNATEIAQRLRVTTRTVQRYLAIHRAAA
jgi:transcriptional regulator with XRE-family HTH domain